jgi:hypothetical protein
MGGNEEPIIFVFNPYNFYQDRDSRNVFCRTLMVDCLAMIDYCYG